MNKIIKNTRIDRRLQRTRKNLLKNLSHSMLVINDAWSNFTRLKTKNQAFMEELSTILVGVNSIKDVCKFRNFPILAQEAEELESALTELIDYPDIADPLFYQAIILKLHDLTCDIHDMIAQQSDDDNDIANSDDFKIVVEERKDRRIFILSDEPQFIAECSEQIGHYGYQTNAFTCFDDYIEAVTDNEPLAVIADLVLLDGGENTLKIYQQKFGHIPMIIVHNVGDFECRLRAVQAGSVSFFVKPVNVSSLLDKLDDLIYKKIMPDPYKVLVIDDSKTISGYLYKTLTNAGMIVHVETQAESGLDMIHRFSPDLILMDMYMPVCDGEDLCRIIRQYESLTSIPIVFLSSETNVTKQLQAMQIGADDFLTKEIDPKNLVMSITTRIERHRVLSSFMTRDSLTGLLNHTTSKNQLEMMINKAQKEGVALVFAMIDIDHFKKVNDTYGHPTGDKVIKSLSRLLKQRLRKTDSIGRYGGEEFAVVLWDTDEIHAKKLIDRLRESFSKIEHRHEDSRFHTTFSSGVACITHYPDSTSISNAADKALYDAKKSGRNMVCIAQAHDTD